MIARKENDGTWSILKGDTVFKGGLKTKQEADDIIWEIEEELRQEAAWEGLF